MAAYWRSSGREASAGRGGRGKGAFLLGDETLENWAYALRTRLLPYAGVRDWWAEAKPIFASETRAWVDEQISATDTSSDLLGIK
jgi:hypothetical protein